MAERGLLPNQSEPLSEKQRAALVKIAADPEAAIKLLPEEDQRKYREAQESVTRARRAGERIARDLWIG